MPAKLSRKVRTMLDSVFQRNPALDPAGQERVALEAGVEKDLVAAYFLKLKEKGGANGKQSAKKSAGTKKRAKGKRGSESDSSSADSDSAESDSAGSNDGGKNGSGNEQDSDGEPDFSALYSRSVSSTTNAILAKQVPKFRAAVRAASTPAEYERVATALARTSHAGVLTKICEDESIMKILIGWMVSAARASASEPHGNVTLLVKLLDAFAVLPVTLATLRQVPLGKVVNRLTKNGAPAVQTRASRSVAEWAKLLRSPAAPSGHTEVAAAAAAVTRSASPPPPPPADPIESNIISVAANPAKRKGPDVDEIEATIVSTESARTEEPPTKQLKTTESDDASRRVVSSAAPTSQTTSFAPLDGAHQMEPAEPAVPPTVSPNILEGTQLIDVVSMPAGSQPASGDFAMLEADHDGIIAPEESRELALTETSVQPAIELCAEHLDNGDSEASSGSDSSISTSSRKKKSVKWAENAELTKTKYFFREDVPNRAFASFQDAERHEHEMENQKLKEMIAAGHTPPTRATVRVTWRYRQPIGGLPDYAWPTVKQRPTAGANTPETIRQREREAAVGMPVVYLNPADAPKSPSEPEGEPNERRHNPTAAVQAIADARTPVIPWDVPPPIVAPTASAPIESHASSAPKDASSGSALPSPVAAIPTTQPVGVPSQHASGPAHVSNGAMASAASTSASAAGPPAAAGGLTIDTSALAQLLGSLKQPLQQAQQVQQASAPAAFPTFHPQRQPQQQPFQPMQQQPQPPFQQPLSQQFIPSQQQFQPPFQQAQALQQHQFPQSQAPQTLFPGAQMPPGQMPGFGPGLGPAGHVNDVGMPGVGMRAYPSVGGGDPWARDQRPSDRNFDDRRYGSRSDYGRDSRDHDDRRGAGRGGRERPPRDKASGFVSKIPCRNFFGETGQCRWADECQFSHDAEVFARAGYRLNDPSRGGGAGRGSAGRGRGPSPPATNEIRPPNDAAGPLW